MRGDRAFYLITLLVVGCGAFSLALSGRVTFVAMACIPVLVTNWYWHFNPQRKFIPDWMATLICIAATFVTLASLGGGRAHLAELYANVPSAGRLLVIVAWVMLFRKKTPRDFAWLYVISFMMLVCTALLVPEVQFALGFFAMLVLTLCACGLLYVKAEAERAGQRMEGGRGVAIRRFGSGYIFFNAAVALAILAPTGFIFLALPRGRPRRIPGAMRPIQETTAVMGFSETVELGSIGSVLENPTRVMQVEISIDGEPATSDYQPLMRGMAFDFYDGRAWKDRGSTKSGGPDAMYRDDFNRHLDEEGGQVVECDVVLEPLNTRKLFAPFAVKKVELPRSRRLRINSRADTFELRTIPGQQMHYKTWSIVVPPEEREWRIRKPGEGEESERYIAHTSSFLQLPDSLPPRVRRLAYQIAPRNENLTDLQIARRMSRHLYNNYAYSLDVTNTPGMDPIDEFLFVRKTGYCEHYATAMALLLRARGIPSRLVAGFKAGIYNDMGGYFTFRQSDAHSWVEAYVLPYGWVTFDPTGLSQSQRNTAPRHMAGVRDFFDVIRTAWIRYVVAYDYVEQSRVLQAIRALWQTVQDFIDSTFFERAEDVAGKKILLRPKVHAFLITGAILIAIVVALVVLWRMAFRKRRPKITTRFYRNLLRVFARRGLRRDPGTTPREFAESVRDRFPVCAEAVDRITDRFCELRYAGRALAAHEEADLLGAVRTVQQQLTSAKE